LAKIDNPDEATARIEAALYSAGRPLRIEDIVRASGTESRTKTLDLLNNIMKKTKSAFKALEIVMLPDGSYVMQLNRTLHTCNQYHQNNLWKQEALEYMHISKNYDS
jgi:chromosome segregation and condensation protein ScpB